jgi:hypothetical protein
MKPYQASGNSARLRLIERECAPYDVQRLRLRESLRSFKFVINCLCVCGIILIPGIGAATRSAEAAFLCAVLFIVVIGGLELLERRLKRQLVAIIDRANAPRAPATSETA